MRTFHSANKLRTKNQEPRTKNQEPRTKNQEPRTNLHFYADGMNILGVNCYGHDSAATLVQDGVVNSFKKADIDLLVLGNYISEK
jgi:hypothetical protein